MSANNWQQAEDLLPAPILERVKRGAREGGPIGASRGEENLDPARAETVLPVIKQLLGLQ